MTAQLMVLVLSAWLVALGLGAAIMRRHRVTPVIGGQLGGLGAILAILALVGTDGVTFVVFVAALTGLMGLLVAALQNVAVDDALGDDAGDPLKW